MGALQPMLFTYDPERASSWVDATPFRAHVCQLLATGLTEPVIAQLTDMSVRAVRHLAHGRHGRPIRRICSETAQRLLELTTAEARAMRFRPVPVRVTRRRLRELVAAGWTEDRVAQQAEIGIRDVQQAIGSGTATCAQLTALKVAAVHEQWRTEREFPGLYAAVA